MCALGASDSGHTSFEAVLSSCRSQQRLEAPEHFYSVKCPLLKVDRATILETRIGTFLQKQGFVNLAIHVALFVAIVLYFIPFGQPAERTATDINGGVRTILSASDVQLFSWSCLTLLCVFLIAHLANRDIFVQCICTFDFLVIVGSGALIQAVWYCNWYLVFIKAGEWTWHDIPIKGLEFIASMCVYVTIAAMDCLTMRYSRRMLLCSVVFITFLAEFIVVRFEWHSTSNFFSDEVLDWWLISTTPDEIYISGKLQLLLFIGKAMVAYAYGQPFSCIKADYSVPGRQVRVEQVTEQALRQMSFISRSSKSSSLTRSVRQVLEEVDEEASEEEGSHNPEDASTVRAAVAEIAEVKESESNVDETHIGPISL